MFKIKPNPEPKPKKEMRPLATAVEVDKLKAFENIADENNLTKSELLRQIVEQFLKASKGGNK